MAKHFDIVRHPSPAEKHGKLRRNSFPFLDYCVGIAMVEVKNGPVKSVGEAPYPESHGGIVVSDFIGSPVVRQKEFIRVSGGIH